MSDNQRKASAPFTLRLDALREKAAEFKMRAADAAAKAGYIQSATDQFATAWRSVEHASHLDSTLVPWLASGEALAQDLDRTLDGLTVSAQGFGGAIDLSLPVFSTASSSSVMVSNSLSVNPTVIFQPCPFLPDSDEGAYASKLEQLNPALAATYRGAWSSHFDQTHDPGRSALWQMRQVFDHFFEMLAPDGAVRASEHWTPKDGPKQEAVHRRERLVFAAHQWVQADRRINLVESVTSTLQAYERLNAAHTRDALAQDKSQEAFRGVDAVIRRWIDSVTPWPPNIRALDG